MSRPDAAPLIVTTLFDDASFAVLDRMRQQHFPARLNRVPAHISLFHNLPGAEERAVLSELSDRCRPMAPISLQPRQLDFLGRGVALGYESPELSALHAELSRAFAPWLTAQDRQRFKAHVTIQNKVDPAEARALRDRLRDEPAPPADVEGLILWRYLGGPWERVATCRFGEGLVLDEG